MGAPVDLFMAVAAEPQADDAGTSSAPPTGGHSFHRGLGAMARRSIGRRGNGFKEQPSTYRISAAPTGRGRCRRCRNSISLGETRLEVCVFVKPGRYTLLLRCTKQKCIDAPLASAILAVYKRADRVPVDAALEGGAEAHRVVRSITSAGLGIE